MKNVSVSHVYKFFFIFLSSFCFTSIFFLNRWGAKSAKTSATTRVRSKQIFIIYFASSRFLLLLLLFPLPFFCFNMKVVYWKIVDWYYKYYNNCLLLSVTPAKSRITFKMLRHKRRDTWNRMGQNKIYHAHVSWLLFHCTAARRKLRSTYRSQGLYQCWQSLAIIQVEKATR